MPSIEQLSPLSPAVSWQEELRTALRTAKELAEGGWIRPEEVAGYEQVLSKYRFVLPRYYASLIDRQDPHCPIRLQAIPKVDEMDLDDLSTADPLEDLANRPADRVTHRYRDRVLIHLTSSCSMYCRFCFRKSLLNELASDLFEGTTSQSVEYVRNHPEIREVIFSGGDPFLSSETTLFQVLEGLSRLAHVQRIRFHTRVPVTLPSRVTESFAQKISRFRKTIVVVHFNHPRELTQESVTAVSRLRAGGATVLNQSVLLKGVNDSADVLEELSAKLFVAGVLPYYLHHPDPARGTRHFWISEQRGAEIHRELRSRMSGYLVPRYVVDRTELPYKSFVCRD